MAGKYKLKAIVGQGMRLPDGRVAPLHGLVRNCAGDRKEVYPPEYGNKAYLVVIEYRLPKVKETLLLAVQLHAPDELKAMHRICTAKTRELANRTTKHLLYVRENKKWMLIRE